MANITRKQHKIFAALSANNGQFGSDQAGSPVVSNDPDVIQALPAYNNGWLNATIGTSELPTLEDMQGLQYNNSYQTAYLLQKGIPEWNNLTDYHTGDIVRQIGGSRLYKSITDDNINNPIIDLSNWQYLGNLDNLFTTEVITTEGDLIKGNSSGEAERLPVGTAGQILQSNGTNPVWANKDISTTTTKGQSLLPDQITISNGTDSDHDIDFTAGNFNFDDGSGQTVATALTKQIDSSWVAGDNAGGLDTGTVAADTTYHCFAIWNPTTETADFLFSTSLASPTLPSGYTKKTRVGSIITNNSSNIILFVQRGQEFILKTKITEVNINSSIPTSLTDLVVTSPNGLITSVLMGCHIQTNNTTYESPTVFAKDKNLDTEVIIGADGRGSDFTGKTMNNFSIYSDTNSTIQYRATDSGTWNLQIFCFGWVDYQL